MPRHTRRPDGHPPRTPGPQQLRHVPPELSSTPPGWTRGSSLKRRRCYRLSKQLNCFHGTCSGLRTWRPRCTEDASSGTRHVVLLPPLSLITRAIVLLNGGVNPMTPALSMTHASVPVPVPFPQLSLPVHSYPPITPSPCTLGQQVITSLSRLLFSLASCTYRQDNS